MNAPVQKIHHHPGNELLLAYAAGGLSEAMALIVASHLPFCVRCRRIAARAEAVGAARLEETEPAPLRPDAMQQALARLDGQQMPVAANDLAPSPLHSFLGRELSAVRWRKMGPRLAYVPLGRQGDVTLRLLKGAPGTDVGSHSHRGTEYTLVLAGGYTDDTGSYGPGDFQTATPELNHNPVADDDGDCINLAVTTGPLRFDGLVQKIAGKLFGF